MKKKRKLAKMSKNIQLSMMKSVRKTWDINPSTRVHAPKNPKSQYRRKGKYGNNWRDLLDED